MQIKTQIKEARWSTKSFIKEGGIMNICSPIFYQGEDLFIETDSSLLFEIICKHFFKKYPDKKIEITLQGIKGVLFARSYASYTYDLIHEALTGDSDIDNIFDAELEDEDLSDMVAVTPHTKEHQQKLLEIIDMLEIDFKQEQQYRRLFDMRKKMNFRIEELR